MAIHRLYLTLANLSPYKRKTLGITHHVQVHASSKAAPSHLLLHTNGPSLKHCPFLDSFINADSLPFPSASQFLVAYVRPILLDQMLPESKTNLVPR